jgi:hypothetical protein
VWSRQNERIDLWKEAGAVKARYPETLEMPGEEVIRWMMKNWWKRAFECADRTGATWPIVMEWLNWPLSFAPERPDGGRLTSDITGPVGYRFQAKR